MAQELDTNSRDMSAAAPASLARPPPARLRRPLHRRRRMDLFVEGMHLRHWVFDMTDPIHFNDDIHRGCYWGLKASGSEGYLNQYEKMRIERPEWQDAALGYLARLRPAALAGDAAMGRLAACPSPARGFRAADRRLAAALGLHGARATVQHRDGCLRRHPRIFAHSTLGRPRNIRSTARHFRGVWQGCAAASLLWFNPAVLLNAYGWPSWDSWIIPWYLLAALLASTEWWFCAGLAIAIGAMFKGQQLAVAPIFVLWPLVQGRVGSALRWLSGLIFGFAAIASPWLVSYLPLDRVEAARRIQTLLPVTLYPPNLFAIPRTIDIPAIVWIAGLLIVAAAVPWILRIQLQRPDSRIRAIVNSNRFWTLAAAVIILLAAYWPWFLPRNHHGWRLGLLAAAVLAAAALWFRPRHQPYVLAAATGTSLLLCMDVFHGSSAWWDCAFHFGTIHWPFMIQGLTSNIPGMLEVGATTGPRWLTTRPSLFPRSWCIGRGSSGTGSGGRPPL